ncbi:protein kinase family protein [Bacillus sp. HMF5848]|uniref:protein kinase domain-containing protein n=1 Tax=Bacillus sp. HMF5848 TaxID=2495421 RepID=UPI000F78DFCB|nr:protein kinase family protein [Bacillus sp. HMF5848]RSK25500.1 protein kinase family protein [Bacillus sp. HMF5848]
MNTWKNQDINFTAGTVIVGKWHKHSYTIVKVLGKGATGVVYLVRTQKGFAALKVSFNGMSVTAEVNVLKAFAKVQGSTLGPSLLDVDDWEDRGKQPVAFYVMEYIKGESMTHFVNNHGTEWLPVLILQLLDNLSGIHDIGWVFGDLKPDNLIVSGPPIRIRCIDVGGTTMQGRAVKEFTEFFDRGYWGFGSRKAEPSYDLFAIGMIMMNAAYPNRFDKTDQPRLQLRQKLENSNLLKPYREFIWRALNGQYQSAKEMRQSLLTILSKNSSTRKAQTSSQQTPPNKKRVAATGSRHVTKPSKNKQTRGKTTRKRGFIETLFIAILLLLAYGFYIYSELL